MGGSLRVGTGTVKGRRLKRVTGSIRPTSGRVRGSLFDMLADRVVDRNVLDVCAGSGSLGIEALSRGARFALFADIDRQAVRLIHDNLRHCGFESRSKVWCTDAVRALHHISERSCRFDVVLTDPPYGDPVVEKIIHAISENAILTPDGVLVVEHQRKNPPAMPSAGLTLQRRRDFGDTTLSFYQPDATSPISLPNQPIVSPVDLPPPYSRSRR